MRSVSLLAACLVFTTRLSASAQVVDHTSVAAFDALTPAQVATATARTVLFVDRSVGDNISSGLNCLATPYATALNSCKRWKHKVPIYNAQPEPWTGTYPRTWTFLGHSGIQPALPCTAGEMPLPCFVRYVDEHSTLYQIVQFQTSYLLDGTDGPTYLAAMRGLRLRHPGLIVALATTSLPRSADATHTAFNAAVRAAVSEGFPLLDVADIESHDQTGRAWFDNRDGVAYSNGNCTENYPDDGVSTEAVAPQYTSECDGGHLGNPDVGKIRVAKALWVLVAGL